MSTDTATLLALGAHARQAPCVDCAPLRCAGWESLPGGVSAAHLQPAGTLCDPALEDPTLAEHHPRGSHAWSADAPIAPRWFPYNRCTLWQCPTCRRAYLRYTEHGGYYSDERIRLLDAALVDDAPLD